MDRLHGTTYSVMVEAWGVGRSLVHRSENTLAGDAAPKRRNAMGVRLRLLITLAIGLLVLAACGTPQPPEPPATTELAVALDGAGDGTVTSDPEGIDTDANEVTANFEVGTTITLEAEAAPGSVFTGWSGDPDCTGTGPCTITLDDDTTITATFEATATLTVNVVTAGGADGSVTSDVVGLDNGIDTAVGDTTATYLVGTPVTLTKVVSAGGFAGWTGDACAGLKTPTCEITLTGDLTIDANFNAIETRIVRVGANTDDAVEFLAASSTDPDRWPEGWVWSQWQRFDLGYDPDHAQTEVGLRFPNVSLPPGTNVLEATLQLSAFTSGGTAGAFDLIVTGQLEADPTGFPEDPEFTLTPSFNITNRTDRTAGIAWPISAGAWTADESYESSDIATIIQEVIALPDWSTDDALVLFLSNDDPLNTESRRVWSFDVLGAADPDDPRIPTLIIEYVALP